VDAVVVADQNNHDDISTEIAWIRKATVGAIAFSHESG
jgi:hypothetical protein